MSALKNFGSSLVRAIRRIMRTPIVDEVAVKNLIRDIQRTLLQADVNVGLVLELSRKIEERALEEKLPPGISRHEHVVKVVYEELTKFLGEKPAEFDIKTGKPNVLMLVGIQGSGKTTSAAKVAKYFKKRGYRTALVCADTYRPGAYAQLKQLAERIKVPIYGNDEEANPLKVADLGVKKFRDEGYDLIIVDTAGRHKDEKSLMEEMKETARSIKPDEIMLVVDATIGQQASVQAKAFQESTEIGSIFVAKLDSSARGGGALSAVAATGAPIKFIGTGEKMDDIEAFVPSRFIGRLLGVGDVEALVRKVREAEITLSEEKAKALLSGNFTLDDMYEQLDAMRRMGPLKKILEMIPGMVYRLPDEAIDVAEERMEKWKYVIQSMTKEERMNPKIINSSRIRRIARGSGVDERYVRELVKQYLMMKRYAKALRRRRMPKQLFKMFSRGGFGVRKWG